MKRRSRPWLPLVLTSMSMLILGSIALAQPQESIGKVAALEGQAKVRHKESSRSEPLTPESPLYREDIIQTGAASKIKLRFNDGSVLILGANATVEITAFVYSPPQDIQTSMFTIFLGAFRATIEKVLPRAKMEVITPTAVAAIRGTDWMGEVKIESTAIVVLKGKVAISNIRPELRGEVSLTEGMGTTVMINQSPTPPNKWETARVNALLKATALP